MDWTLPVLEGMGIDNLTLRRNLVSIQTHNSERGWEVRLESEKLYYLAIRVLGRRRKTLPIPSGKCGDPGRQDLADRRLCRLRGRPTHDQQIHAAPVSEAP